LVLSSDRGTVTAELAIALPAVLMVLTFSVQVLGIQVDRVAMVGSAAMLARQAARGENVAGSKVEGNLVCVTRERKSFVPVIEKQCARRLGI
jgi:hypothetical protein